DRQPLGKLGLLELNAQPRPDSTGVGAPAHPEDLDLALVRLLQSLEDLDRGGLARAVRSQQAEALSAADLQIDGAQCDRLAEPLLQAAAPDGSAVPDRGSTLGHRARFP